MERWPGPKAHQPGAESENFMHYVYILKSLKNGKLYKGCTNNLKRRLKEHANGKSEFTKQNGPWRLLYYEGFESKLDAEAEEKFLKSGKGKERVKYLLHDTLKT